MSENYNYNLKFSSLREEVIWSNAKKYLTSINWFEILKKGIFAPKNSFYEKNICEDEQTIMLIYYYITKRKEFCEDILNLKFEITEEKMEDERFSCKFINTIKVTKKEGKW